MAWMRIKSFDSNVEVTAQIFEFNSTYFNTIPNRTIKTTQSQGYNTVSFIYNRSPFLTEQQAVDLFSDWVIDKSDSNSMIQVSFKYSENNGVYEPDALFLPIQVGVKPESWDTHRWLYYTRGTYVHDGKTYVFYKYANQNWNNQTQYYEEDTNPRKRGFCRYIADTGCVFSLTRGFASSNTYDNRGTSDFLIRNSSGANDSSYSGYVAPGNNLINCDMSSQSENGFYEQTWGTGGVIESESNIMVFFVHTKYNDIDYYGLAKIALVGEARPYPALLAMTLIDVGFWGTSVSNVPPPSPSHWGDDSTTGGGNGSFIAHSDILGTLNGSSLETESSRIATIMDTNVASAGFHVYRMQNASYQSTMGQFIASIYSSDYLTRLAASRYNPLSCVLSYHLLPPTLVDVVGTKGDVLAGGYNFTTQPSTEFQVPQQYLQSLITHKWLGSYDFYKYFDAYPDFAPYTSIIIHLPYVGVIELDVNAVMHGSISVDYICDVVNGNIAAYITCKDRLGNTAQKYVATGNCAYTIPLFSENQSGAELGKLASGLAVGTVAAAMGYKRPLFSMVGDYALSAIEGLQRAPKVSGSFNGNTGMICDDVCWIEIIRPEWTSPANYQNQEGIPVHISGTIESFYGFLSIDSIDLTNCTATADEIQEIETLLKSGILINNPNV